MLRIREFRKKIKKQKVRSQISQTLFPKFPSEILSASLSNPHFFDAGEECGGLDTKNTGNYPSKKLMHSEKDSHYLGFFTIQAALRNRNSTRPSNRYQSSLFFLQKNISVCFDPWTLLKSTTSVHKRF